MPLPATVADAEPQIEPVLQETPCRGPLPILRNTCPSHTSDWTSLRKPTAPRAAEGRTRTVESIDSASIGFDAPARRRRRRPRRNGRRTGSSTRLRAEKRGDGPRTIHSADDRFGAAAEAQAMALGTGHPRGAPDSRALPVAACGAQAGSVLRTADRCARARTVGSASMAGGAADRTSCACVRHRELRFVLGVGQRFLLGLDHDRAALLSARSGASKRPLPDGVVPPDGNWMRTTAQHLAHWALYSSRSGDRGRRHDVARRQGRSLSERSRCHPSIRRRGWRWRSLIEHEGASSRHDRQAGS